MVKCVEGTKRWLEAMKRDFDRLPVWKKLMFLILLLI